MRIIFCTSLIHCFFLLIKSPPSLPFEWMQKTKNEIAEPAASAPQSTSRTNFSFEFQKYAHKILWWPFNSHFASPNDLCAFVLFTLSHSPIAGCRLLCPIGGREREKRHERIVSCIVCAPVQQTSENIIICRSLELRRWKRKMCLLFNIFIPFFLNSSSPCRKKQTNKPRLESVWTICSSSYGFSFYSFLIFCSQNLVWEIDPLVLVWFVEKCADSASSVFDGVRLLLVFSSTFCPFDELIEH